MNLYHRLVEISRQQLEAFQCDDLRTMHQLIVERQTLIDRLGTPGKSELAVLQEVLDCDRILSDGLRERMLSLRSEAAEVHQRRTNLNGYRMDGGASAHLLDLVL
jgi:hypothetical protein